MTCNPGCQALIFGRRGSASRREKGILPVRLESRRRVRAVSDHSRSLLQNIGKDEAQIAGADDRLSRRSGHIDRTPFAKPGNGFRRGNPRCDSYRSPKAKDSGARKVFIFGHAYCHPAEARPLRFNGFHTWSPRKYCRTGRFPCRWGHSSNRSPECQQSNTISQVLRKTSGRLGAGSLGHPVEAGSTEREFFRARMNVPPGRRNASVILAQPHS